MHSLHLCPVRILVQTFRKWKPWRCTSGSSLSTSPGFPCPCHYNVRSRDVRTAMKDMKEIRAVKPDVLCGQVSGKENNLVHRSVIMLVRFLMAYILEGKTIDVGPQDSSLSSRQENGIRAQGESGVNGLVMATSVSSSRGCR